MDLLGLCGNDSDVQKIDKSSFLNEIFRPIRVFFSLTHFLLKLVNFIKPNMEMSQREKKLN